MADKSADRPANETVQRDALALFIYDELKRQNPDAHLLGEPGEIYCGGKTSIDGKFNITLLAERILAHLTR